MPVSRLITKYKLCHLNGKRPPEKRECRRGEKTCCLLPCLKLVEAMAPAAIVDVI